MLRTYSEKVNSEFKFRVGKFYGLFYWNINLLELYTYVKIIKFRFSNLIRESIN